MESRLRGLKFDENDKVSETKQNKQVPLLFINLILQSIIH